MHVNTCESLLHPPGFAHVDMQVSTLADILASILNHANGPNPNAQVNLAPATKGMTLGGTLPGNNHIIPVLPGIHLNLANCVLDLPRGSSLMVHNGGELTMQCVKVIGHMVVEGVARLLCCNISGRPTGAGGQPPGIHAAVHVHRGGQATLSQDTILSSAYGPGLLVEGDTSRAAATGCTVANCTGDGISVKDNGAITATNCTSSNNKGHGFSASGAGAHLLVVGCDATDNSGHGYASLSGATMTLQDSCIASRNADGFHASGPQSHMLMQSALSVSFANKGYGYQVRANAGEVGSHRCC
jgi:hypothetical protein